MIKNKFINTYDFVRIGFSMLLVTLVISCQSQTAPNKIAYNDEQTKTSDNISLDKQENTSSEKEIISATTLNCGNKDFNLIVEYENGSKSINLTENNKTIKKINLPTQNEINGFALNWAKKTKEGFEISIEYGSRFYYQKDFNFTCWQNSFYLNNIKTTTFDKNNPDTSWKESGTNIKPNLSLENFSFNDYLKDKTSISSK